jgi:cytochrome P450
MIYMFFFYQTSFIGGTKTVIDTSVWTMTEIMRKPTLLKKAHEELDNVVGRSRMVQETDIPSLKYIQAIIKETLRLHPAIPTLVPHKSQSACKVSGYIIPANTWVFCDVWAIGRDASIWENPLEFNPDRFMKNIGNENIDFQGQNFELLPFGSGRRVCPGMTMGSKMLHLNIANMLHAFDWSLPLEEGKKDLSKKKMTMSSDDSRFQPIFLEAIPTVRLPAHIYHVKKL